MSRQTPEAPSAPPPLPPSFTDTPEFRTAVAQQVEAFLRSSAVPSLGHTEQSFADRLALSFATLSEQGTGRRYVAPEVLRARAEARERMLDLIEAAMRDKEVATYQLTTKIQLMGDFGPEVVDPLWTDSTRVTRPTVIDWQGEPNEGMRPMNDTACAIYDAYIASIGTTEKYDPKRKIGITARGRIVSGNAVQPHMERNPLNDDESAARAPGYRVHHAGEPGREVKKHILGTIHPPASFQV